MTRRWTRVAILAVALGIVARLVWGLWVHPPFDYVYSDMSVYVGNAAAAAHGVPVGQVGSLMPPGTYQLLAIPFALFGTGSTGMWVAAVLWALLACSIPLLAWLFAARLLDHRAGAVTAILVSFWPPLVTQGGYFLSEIPAIAFLLSALCALSFVPALAARRQFVAVALAAVAGTLAITVRPPLALNLIIGAAPLMFVVRRRPLLAAVGVAVAAVPLSAVLLINHHQTSTYSLGSNGGLNFFQGHCNAHQVGMGGSQVGWQYWVESPVALQQHRGVDYQIPPYVLPSDQSYFYRRGLQCITRDGLGHLRVLAANVLDLGATSHQWPQSNERLVSDLVNPVNAVWAFLLPIVVVGSLKRLRRNGDAVIALLGHLSCAVVVALVYYGDPRFRLPYDIFGLALLALWVTEYRTNSRRKLARTRKNASDRTWVQFELRPHEQPLSRESTSTR